MTPQYILRKALCRQPHCFSAHVPGKGYVNDGTDPVTAEDYRRQYLRAAESEIENMQWAAGYAEGREAPARGILFANWNVLPRAAGDLLERAGYACEWSDQWGTCEDCGNAISTSPDSYCWRPFYREDLIESGSMVCLDCAPYPACSTCDKQTDAENIYDSEYCSRDCYDARDSETETAVSE